MYCTFIYYYSMVKPTSRCAAVNAEEDVGEAVPDHVTSACYVVRPAGVQVRWMGV